MAGILTDRAALKYHLYKFAKVDDQIYRVCQEDLERQNTFWVNVLLPIVDINILLEITN